MKITSPRHLRRRENLRLLVDEFGGVTSVALAVNTPKSHISAMLAGARGMGDELAAKIGRKCKDDPGWMDEQHSFERVDAEVVSHDLRHAKPIVRRLRAIDWSQLMDADLSAPFELPVIDDALAPDLYVGCVIRFDPVSERPAKEGWPCLVRDSSGRFYVRDYEVGPGASWRAVARRRGFAPLESERDGLVVVAVMKGVDYP